MILKRRDLSILHQATINFPSTCPPFVLFCFLFFFPFYCLSSRIIITGKCLLSLANIAHEHQHIQHRVHHHHLPLFMDFFFVFGFWLGHGGSSTRTLNWFSSDMHRLKAQAPPAGARHGFGRLMTLSCNMH